MQTMQTMQTMQSYFNQLADTLTAACQGDEVLLLHLSAEESDFVRFNRSAIRQGGVVEQRYLTLELIVGQRHVSETITLTGQGDVDAPRTLAVLGALRACLPEMPEDPYLLYATDVVNTEQLGDADLAPVDGMIDAILDAGQGQDLVGILARGGVYAGFANSLGQRNWFSTKSFHVDWSFYLQGDKAVKTAYAGLAGQWSAAAFLQKVEAAHQQLAVLGRPSRTIQPGEYRTYLTPDAVSEYIGILGWGGFGVKSHRTKSTPMLKMIEEGATLSPSLTIRENTAEGLAPNFTSKGYVKPDAIDLIVDGEYREAMVSPRSAKEFALDVNAGGEGPESMDVSAGSLEAADAVAELGEGVYAGCLWYLNYSDMPAGRVTGMTRFATFWVEGGEIVAPLNVMRFDETIYRALGENLVALTKQRDFIPSSQTYEQRSTDSMRMPGALIDNFRFTL